jgi:taurine dioxygenase
VNPGFTTEICEFGSEESERTLDFLFQHMTEPRFIYRHAWSVGDVVICDHALCIHQGTGDYELPQRRLLRRTMVKGSVPS